MNSSSNPFIGLSEHGIKETIQVLRDAKAITHIDKIELEHREIAIGIAIDDLENRVIQRIKHSPLAKLLASHKVPSTNKEPKE